MHITCSAVAHAHAKKTPVPNDPSQQILFVRDLSSSVLSAYANENLVLGGDFNCVTRNAMEKKGGRPFDSKNSAVTEFE